MNAVDLRVVVLTYGTGGEHERLLDSLAGEGMEPDRILVVHNPSTPGERPPSVPSGYEVVTASHNLGYSAGMNLGIQQQLGRGCELLLLLTHDARLRPGALEKLVDAAKANPRYGVLGPALLLTGTDIPFSFGGTTGPNGSVCHLKVEPPAPEEVAPCDWVDGGTMLLRADALERVGGFDERFWGYCEDADLCLRMERAGCLVGAVVDAWADQAPGGAKRPGPWAYLLTRNGAAYAQRFAGARGVSYMAGRAVLLALFELLRIAARMTPFRDGSLAAPWAIAVGRIRGMLDFFRGRWGPPPAGLPGGGDMQNVAPISGGPEMPDDRPRVLHLGPHVPGGMNAAMRGLFASPLSRRYRLDVVATHRGLGLVQRLTVYSLALLRLTWWSICGRGRVVHIHSTKRGSMYRKGVCVLLAKALRRRVVLHVHAGPGDVAAFRAELGPARAAFLRLSYRVADTVLAVSAASARALERAFEVSDIIVLPNAAPAGPRELPRRTDRAHPLAIYMGGFENPVKGGDIVLDALARPETVGLRVVLAGPGDLPEPGRRLVEDRRAIEWRGWLDEMEKDELLRKASIFILSSTSEGLPMALLEAMAYGLAVVATEVGGVPDVVDPGRDGLVIPPGDAIALADALVLLARDPDLRERLGSAARGRASQLDGVEVADRLDALYRRLL